MGKLRKMSFNNASSSEPIIISGHLYKMKRNPQAMSMSDWNKRFFTIEGDFMFWHKAKGSERSGKVKISDIKSVKIVNSSRQQLGEERNSTFLVKARERTLYLRSERAPDADRWVRMIQMQVDLRNGGTSQGPKCEKNQKKTNGGGDKFDLLSRELDKLLENVEKVEIEVNSPKTGSMRKGRMGGAVGRGATGTKTDLVIDDNDEDDRKMPAKKVTLSVGGDGGGRRRRRRGGGRDEEVTWGGRVDFENDKSILEPVSPRRTSSIGSSGDDDRDEDNRAARSSNGIRVRKKAPSKEKENKVEMVSPPKVTYTTPPKKKSPQGKFYSNNNHSMNDSPGGMSSSTDESHSPGGYNFDQTLAAPIAPKISDNTPSSGNRKKRIEREEDFASPLSVETTTMSEMDTPAVALKGSEFSPISNNRPPNFGGKKKSKKNETFKEDEIDFESSLESLEEINTEMEAGARDGWGKEQRGNLELQEFAELDDLEEMAHKVGGGGKNSGRLKEKGKRNRVSLVRSSNDGEVIVSNSRDGKIKSSSAW